MQNNKKKILQSVMIIVAALFIVLGILSVVQATGSDVGLTYISKISNMILRYVVVIVTNAIGIMLMSYAAGTCEGKLNTYVSRRRGSDASRISRRYGARYSRCLSTISRGRRMAIRYLYFGDANGRGISCVPYIFYVLHGQRY